MTDSPGTTKPVLLTRAGAERLRQELRTLREERRPSLARQLQRAKLFMEPGTGENAAAVAGYDLGVLDQQIAQLEDLLRRAEVVEPSPDDTVAQLGSTVTVRYEDGAEEAVRLVPPIEAGLTPGAVSSESPAGQALLGKAAGADVTVGTGDDASSLSVVAIGKPDEPADSTTDTEGVGC